MSFVDSLTTANWIAIAAILVGSIFSTFTVLNYFAGRRERKLRTYEITPEVKATINTTTYKDRWRSVQLHMGAPPEQPDKFKYDNWCIEHARLLRPRSAVLARAENDDYATGVFYPEKPIRELAGRAEGRPQRFALEFFIRFKGDDTGGKAKFKVTFSHVKNNRRQYTRTVWATFPINA